MRPPTHLTDSYSPALTEAVTESFAGAESERLRTVITSLVRHLHAFASEVSLTERDWELAVDFVTRTGQMCTDKRQEVILLSDVLGLSMLVVDINHGSDTRATQSTVLGPFFVEGAPRFENGANIAAGAPGEPCLVSGQVTDVDGQAVPGARIDVWQADEDGLYDIQRTDTEAMSGRGVLTTDADGRFWFWSVKPEPYPIPDDGPVGELLNATGRSRMRPAHVHFRVTAPGFKPLTTHVFVDDDPYLDTDAVFGVKQSLIASFERHGPGAGPGGDSVDVPYWTMTYDLVLVAE